MVREDGARRPPRVTVDALVLRPQQGLLLVRRRFPPPGWALPGGFVDPGETLEEAVCRELNEETGLQVLRLRQFHAYSDPARDPRGPTVGMVFEVEAVISGRHFSSAWGTNKKQAEQKAARNALIELGLIESSLSEAKEPE